MADLKIMVGEVDGVEQDNAEYRYNAEDQDFSDPSFSATKTKAAILEARNSGKVFCDLAGHEAKADVGRWLSREKDNPSNEAPYVCITERRLKRASLVVKNNATVTVTIYRNVRATQVVIGTISISNSKQAMASYDVLLEQGVELGYKVTSGTCDSPSIQLEFET